MTSSSIEAAAEWLGKLAVHEVQFLGEVSSKVEELKSELEWMQCFLMDADEKQNKNVLIRKWVSEIRDLAFSAEDLVESYILKVQYQKQEGFLNYLKWLALFWMDAFTLHDIGSDLDALTAKISKMTSRLQSYGVKSSYDTNLSHVFMTKKLLAEQRRTYAHVEDHDIVGLEDCVTDLTSELLGTKKIVVVHGMGGIGKSTLARELFNHNPLKDHFAGFAWAYISQQLQLGPVCREILLQLIPESDRDERSVVQGLQDSQLPGKLYEMLKQQNYLIVLDDVWFVGAWMSLAPAFPLDDGVSCGSKLLITTRNRDILSDLSNDLVFYYEVKLLNRYKSWELLERKSNFQKDEGDSSMIELGEKMLDHCNGHPFAIAVLGGVLALKKSSEEWQSVLDNLTFHLQRDDSYRGVYEVLALSYNELPYNTKPCFLHLIHFPEDFEIPLDRLYHLWIADGIFSSTQEQFTRNRSLEEIAEVYLMDLVQKSMVQLGGKNLNGQITTCHLHDLMRDKGLEIIKEENFLQVIDLQSNVNVQQPPSKGGSSSKTLRRLSIYVDPKVTSSITEALSEVSSNLRSLVFFPVGEDKATSKWIVTVCEDHQLLRVFDLEGLRLTGSLPREIGNLIFLRCLSLKDTQLTELPTSITNLMCLVILDLRVKGSIKLPNILWKLKSLKQLYFPSRHITQVVIRDNPYKIEEEDDALLVLQDMRNLEKIEGLNLDKLEKLGLEISSLRKVSATCASKEDTLVPFLNTPNIKHLHLALDACIINDHPMLLSTCAALQVLYLDAKQGLYSPLPVKPRMYHENLVQLDISFCTMEVDAMPVLEKLPKLISLGLHVCYQGSEIACSSPEAFPELTYLAFDGLFSLRKWTVARGGLAKLRTLYIGNSPIEILPQVLPTHVAVSCSPCVGGLERYGGCTHVNANRNL